MIKGSFYHKCLLENPKRLWARLLNLLHLIIVIFWTWSLTLLGRSDFSRVFSLNILEFEQLLIFLKLRFDKRMLCIDLLVKFFLLLIQLNGFPKLIYIITSKCLINTYLDGTDQPDSYYPFAIWNTLCQIYDQYAFYNGQLNLNRVG